MSDQPPDLAYWKHLAEQRGARLAEVKAENERLRDEVHRLRWTNRDLAMVPDTKRQGSE